MNPQIWPRLSKMDEDRGIVGEYYIRNKNVLKFRNSYLLARLQRVIKRWCYERKIQETLFDNYVPNEVLINVMYYYCQAVPTRLF